MRFVFTSQVAFPTAAVEDVRRCMRTHYVFHCQGREGCSVCGSQRGAQRVSGVSLHCMRLLVAPNLQAHASELHTAHPLRCQLAVRHAAAFMHRSSRDLRLGVSFCIAVGVAPADQTHMPNPCPLIYHAGRPTVGRDSKANIYQLGASEHNPSKAAVLALRV